MPVDTQHPEYVRYVNTWLQTRDAVSGAVAIKSEKTKYLPLPDKDKTDSNRYKSYLSRALFTNFTARTKNALVGAAFRQPPVVDTPTGLEYIIEDATGDGLGIEQLAKDSLGNILETGREGFLVDYPPVPSDLSEEEQAAIAPAATIAPYVAESVINWRTEGRGGKTVLTLVVLKESYLLKPEDAFSHDSGDQYRVLMLDDSGYYCQQVFREGVAISDPIYPRDASNKLWDEIPFIFAGAQNNDATVDDAPLSDIAEINIAHYRNSADYEEGVFIHGQPMLHIDTGEMSQEDWGKANPDGVVVGARSAIITNSGGSAGLMQAEANGAAHEAMELKEKQLIMLGARIITDRTGQETAEAARIRFSSENSVLGDVVLNLSDALRRCIEWCGRFMGVEGDVVFELNTNFFDKALDPQQIIALVQAHDRGAIAMSDLRRSLRRADFIKADRTDDEIDEEVGTADPLGDTDAE